MISDEIYSKEFVKRIKDFRNKKVAIVNNFIADKQIPKLSNTDMIFILIKEKAEIANNLLDPYVEFFIGGTRFDINGKTYPVLILIFRLNKDDNLIYTLVVPVMPSTIDTLFVIKRFLSQKEGIIAMADENLRVHFTFWDKSSINKTDFIDILCDVKTYKPIINIGSLEDYNSIEPIILESDLLKDKKKLFADMSKSYYCSNQ